MPKQIWNHSFKNNWQNWLLVSLLHWCTHAQNFQKKARKQEMVLCSAVRRTRQTCNCFCVHAQSLSCGFLGALTPPFFLSIVSVQNALLVIQQTNVSDNTQWTHISNSWVQMPQCSGWLKIQSWHGTIEQCDHLLHEFPHADCTNWPHFLELFFFQTKFMLP